MQPSEIQADFLRQVEEASGKPVLLQSDPKFSGHATVKIAREGQPAHVLLYKPDHESELPYLAPKNHVLRQRYDDFELCSLNSLYKEQKELLESDLAREEATTACSVIFGG